MQWIPPALREDRGEVEAALKGALPDLIQESDIRGDLHTHTDLTDGLSTLQQMVTTAAARGYEYYAITDHAPNLYMQQMTDAKMLKQREQVRRLAASGAAGDMVLLHGTELNIDPDGGVDWDADFLEGFEVCVASVHSHFNQSRSEMTRRIITACENPHVNVIGHPTARMIGHRDRIDYDLDAVFEAAARTGTALEINSYPDRLDLNDEHILWARRHGVKFAVDTDSHSTVHLQFLRYGIGMARRGWLTTEDVINTWSLERLRAFLRKGRG
jgi:DNA polymerase (family 10)